MPDLDLLELLSADHRNLLAEEPPSVAELSQHLSVERDLLYPVIHRYAEQGESIVKDLRRDERRLEDRMADMELTAGAEPERAARLVAAVREHVRSQEALFVELRRSLPAHALLRSAGTIPLSIGGAPTHAHPRLAEGGAVAEIVEDMASVSDHMRDRMRQRPTAG